MKRLSQRRARVNPLVRQVFSRPRLEILEDRLCPGDTILGMALMSSSHPVAGSSLSGIGNVPQAWEDHRLVSPLLAPAQEAVGSGSASLFSGDSPTVHAATTTSGDHDNLALGSGSAFAGSGLGYDPFANPFVGLLRDGVSDDSPFVDAAAGKPQPQQPASADPGGSASSGGGGGSSSAPDSSATSSPSSTGAGSAIASALGSGQSGRDLMQALQPYLAGGNGPRSSAPTPVPSVPPSAPPPASGDVVPPAAPPSGGATTPPTAPTSPGRLPGGNGPLTPVATPVQPVPLPPPAGGDTNPPPGPFTASTAAQSPPDIVVGRTLSSYTVAGIQNNQLTITFTVYNQQTDPITGVLLTDTLLTGVTFLSATAQPDQSGANLAWSLGTIGGFDRASVQLTVSLANPVPTQLDSGAHAFGTLHAGAVTNDTPPAVLSTRTIAANLLASTPDANTTDPFVQEKAAELRYDPRQIFSFLQNQIGYNSYAGSLRGARGTLWSSAGNALDVASLGVALMRGSGIPAQYAQGTLSQTQAQQLILSMFPGRFSTVGYIPAGAQISDPANDPQLQSEAETHFWFQFDTGTGMQDADPQIPGSTIGHSFSAGPSTTLTVVPDNLRAKTEVTLTAEIYSQIAAAFGDSPLQNTIVLDQTFNDVDLVGRPLTVGNFVNTTGAGGLVFTTVTNTYTPYVQVGDVVSQDRSRDETITGQNYQEVVTNFPLGSQILTGLFLNITLTDPQGATKTYAKTLVDQFGFAVRQGGGTVQLPPVDPSAPPILSPLDLWTINALPGFQSPNVIALERNALSQLEGQLAALRPVLAGVNGTGPFTPQQNAALTVAATLERNIATITNETMGILFGRASDQALAQLEAGYSTTAYYTSPRLLVSTTQHTGNQLNLSLDLVKNDTRNLPNPGQVVSTTLFFEFMRGLMESSLEGQVASAATGQSPISITEIFAALANSGGQLVLITQDNLQQLQQLSLSATAKARITQAVNAGIAVYTPSQMVQVNGQTTVGWLETDWTTGHTISVMENGGHQEIVEYIGSFGYAISTSASTFVGVVHGFAVVMLDFIGRFLSGKDTSVKDTKEAIVTNIKNTFRKLMVAYLRIPEGTKDLINL